MNEKICPVCNSPIPASAPGGLCPACVLRDAEEPPTPAGAAPLVEAVAAAFPKLEVMELIGQGGMGFVYKVRQPHLDRVVALKILSPELSRDPGFEERFAREARTLAKLHHPNIVTIFDYGESGGFFYLLMEFVDGVNLRQAMRAGRFTPEQALAVVPGICDALQAAHAQNIWHRDIKPENILLDREGRVKIADFGIARIVGDPQRDFTLTMTGGWLGSAAYMAPEQHEKPHDVDHRADIYSLGVVIYEMLTGELPLGRFPLPSQRAEVNARIDDIVLKTLEKERELRQQSATEVKTEMAGAATDATNRKPSRPARTGSRVRFLHAAAFIGGGVLLHLIARSLKSEYEPAAVVLSILGRLGIAAGGVAAVVAAYQRRPRLWAAISGTIVGLVVIVFGTTVLSPLMIIGLMGMAVVLGVFSLIETNRPNRAAEPVRKNTAPAGESAPTRLPLLVCWSLGLLVGGVALMGAAFLVRHEFESPQTNSMMALLIAIGGAASAAGFLCSLWALFEMKRGWMPAIGRGLLIALGVGPLVAGLLIGGVSTIVNLSDLPTTKGAVMMLSASVLGLTALGLWLALWLARPTSPSSTSRRRWARLSLALAAAAILGGALYAKRLDFHWPHAFVLRESSLTLQGRDLPSDTELLALLRKAAGPYAGECRLSVKGGKAQVALLSRDAPDPRLDPPPPDHASNTIRRFYELLPASVAQKAWSSPPNRPNWVHERERDPRYGRERLILGMLVTAGALLAALGGGRRAVALIVGGVALNLALAVLPVWPMDTPPDEPELVEGELLPPIPFEELPAPDFSTPRTALESFYDAAHRKQLEIVRQGASAALAAVLDEQDEWDELMERANRTAAQSVEGDPSSGRVKVMAHDRNRSGQITMVFEAGGWRVDELNYTPPARRSTGPFTKMPAPGVVDDAGIKNPLEIVERAETIDSTDNPASKVANSAHRENAQVPGGEETWTCEIFHATPAEIAVAVEGFLPDEWKSLAAAIPPRTETGVLTLTGSKESVRLLLTLIRAADLWVRDLPLDGKTLYSPEYFVRGALPALACGGGLNSKGFDAAFLSTLKQQGVTSQQIARALASHVFEFEEMNRESTGTPFEVIMKNKGASTTEEVTIPCSDQPDRPLVIELRRTVFKEGYGNSIITGLSPWLIEEAKRQSSEPLTVPKVKSAGPQLTPSVPVEEVFRKMHAAANASDGEEFAKYETADGGVRINGQRPPVISRMEPFFGELLYLKRYESKPGGFLGPLTTDLIAEFKRADGAKEFKTFGFYSNGEEWKFDGLGLPASFRAGVLMEFLPPEGDPETVIRTHMEKSYDLMWVPGERARFFILGTDHKPEKAVEEANENVERLRKSLERVGMDRYLKVIQPAKTPEKPPLRWDEPPPVREQAAGINAD